MQSCSFHQECCQPQGFKWEWNQMQNHIELMNWKERMAHVNHIFIWQEQQKMFRLLTWPMAVIWGFPRQKCFNLTSDFITNFKTSFCESEFFWNNDVVEAGSHDLTLWEAISLGPQTQATLLDKWIEGAAPMNWNGVAWAAFPSCKMSKFVLFEIEVSHKKSGKNGYARTSLWMPPTPRTNDSTFRFKTLRSLR